MGGQDDLPKNPPSSHPPSIRDAGFHLKSHVQPMEFDGKGTHPSLRWVCDQMYINQHNLSFMVTSISSGLVFCFNSNWCAEVQSWGGGGHCPELSQTPQVKDSVLHKTGPTSDACCKWSPPAMYTLNSLQIWEFSMTLLRFDNWLEQLTECREVL